MGINLLKKLKVNLMMTILGIFTQKPAAKEVMEELRNKGIPNKDISIITRSDEETTTDSSSVLEGAVGGATTGGVLGGLAGLLIGAGILTIPGIGALLIGGPLAAALGLTGAAATTAAGATTGAIAGGIVGGLVGMGVPEEEAKTYETKIKEGAVLVAVQTETREEENIARSILETHGANQIRTV